MVDLCHLVKAPSKYAEMEIIVRATIQPSMHGTYLTHPGCAGVLLMALPTEISNRRNHPEVETNSDFKEFERARFDYRLEAPKFIASFTGKLEYARHGKGFGYYHRHKARLIVFKVADVESN